MGRLLVTHVVLMGVAGSGKSTLGAELSRRSGVPFQDGDALHDPAAVAKMCAGVPLTDHDRWPWLDRCGQHLARHPEGLVLGCSALRRAYRDRLRSHAGAGRLLFVHLSGPADILRDRLADREGHFMPPALLQSQLDVLEPPEPDEWSITLDASRPVPDLASAVLRYTERR